MKSCEASHAYIQHVWQWNALAITLPEHGDIAVVIRLRPEENALGQKHLAQCRELAERLRSFPGLAKRLVSKFKFWDYISG